MLNCCYSGLLPWSAAKLWLDCLLLHSSCTVAGLVLTCCWAFRAGAKLLLHGFWQTSARLSEAAARFKGSPAAHDEIWDKILHTASKTLALHTRLASCFLYLRRGTTIGTTPCAGFCGKAYLAKTSRPFVS